MATTVSMPDLPSFRVVAPMEGIKPDDLKMPDGTPMIGPDGLLVPPARNFSMIVNAATRMYSYRFDEAMRDNYVNARAMRRDAFVRGLMEERILPTINRKWQLDVDNKRDNNQRFVMDQLTRIVQAIPNFDALKRALLDGTWFGRAGGQWSFARNPDVEDYWGIPKWDPIHGDSIQFTFDGVPAILLDAMTTGWYSQHGATWGPNGDLRPTDRGGTALVLHRPEWRDRFAIHRHMMEKADYFEGELAGSVQGLGLRGLVYWAYVVRTNALTWMLAYMQSVGQMDLLVFNYPQGNAAAEAQQKQNARQIIGKAAIACPRNPNQNWPAIEQISMNAAGLEALHKLVSEYFDRHIERLIVGQSMSSGQDNKSGLGGTGRADFAKATKDEILVYDTGRLDETLTSDLIAKLKKYNFPWAKFPVRFKSVLPDLEAKEKVKNGEVLIKNKVLISVDEWREAAGFSRPEEGDETVELPQEQPQPGMPGQPGAPGMPPDAGGGQPPAMGPGGQPAPKPPQPAPMNGGAPQLPPAAPKPPQTPPTPAARFNPGFGGGMPVRNELGPSPMGGGYFPGGGNTYIPKREHTPQIGFTRFGAAGSPTSYIGGPKKFGCVMLELDGPGMFAVAQMANDLNDNDLAPKGRETEPHITIRWGLHDGVTPADVAAAIGTFGPIRYRLNRVTTFDGPEHDVVIVEVISPDLHKLNRALGGLPNTQTHPDYKPHATIGYVKSGYGRYYRSRFKPVCMDGIADTVIYSDVGMNRIPIRTNPESVAYAAPSVPAIYAEPQRHDGEVWQGQSGRWFTKRDGRAVPTKAPGGEETTDDDHGATPTADTPETPQTTSPANPGGPQTDGTPAAPVAAPENNAPRVTTKIKDMVDVQAVRFKQSLLSGKYGDVGREMLAEDPDMKQFKKNWNKTLKGLEADPAVVAEIQKSVDYAWPQFGLDPVPVFIRKQTPEEKAIGENAHWDNGFIVISDDVLDENRYRTRVAGLGDENKTTVKQSYPDQLAGLLVHEMGHKFHEENPQLNLTAQAMTLAATKEERKLISKYISSYASTHPQELVAEAFAAWKHPDFNSLPDDAKTMIYKVLGKTPPPASPATPKTHTPINTGDSTPTPAGKIPDAVNGAPAMYGPLPAGQDGTWETGDRIYTRSGGVTTWKSKNEKPDTAGDDRAEPEMGKVAQRRKRAEEIMADVRRAMAEPDKLTPERVRAFTDQLKGVTVVQLRELQREFTLRGGSRLKADRIDRITAFAREKLAASNTPAAEEARLKKGNYKTPRGMESVSPKMRAEVYDTLNAIPEKLHSEFAAYGGTVVVGKYLTEVIPSLRGVQPRGWPPGSTWDMADGAYNRSEKLVISTELMKSQMRPDEDRESPRVAGVIRHEFGHGIDDAWGSYSTTPEFTAAWAEDSKNISMLGRLTGAYFVQEPPAGPSEAFAELLGLSLGKCTTDFNLPDMFPRCSALIRGELDKRGIKIGGGA